MNWSTNLTAKTTTLDAASGSPNRSSLRRSRDRSRSGSARREGRAARRSPPRCVRRRGSSPPCPRAPWRSTRARRASSRLVDHHPAPGAELPLEERGRGRHDAVDHDAGGQHADDASRPGRPSRRRTVGAAATPVGSTLERVERSRRSARWHGEPGQRTIAKLTPSSLKLRTARSASRPTAKVPNSSGPRMRAIAIPIAACRAGDQRVEPRSP